VRVGEWFGNALPIRTYCGLVWRAGLGERLKPFCAQRRQTMKKASLTMCPDIFELPWKRSVKTIGTSTTLRPCRQILCVSSI